MKKPNENLARRKLIGNLVNEPHDGEVQALLTTTYDLNADFFETDFLPSILGLKTWDDRNWAGRIAMEKKLALMEAATVFSEAGRYLGRPRSLRVELVPVKRHPSRLHAKIVLVVNEKSVKLLVTSANLTERGYRHNREAAVLLTATEKKYDTVPLIRSAIQKMPALLGKWWTDSAEKALQAALARMAEWPTSIDNAQEWFFWGGDTTPLWQTFLEHWPSGEPVYRMAVVSPFWAEEPGAEFMDLFFSALAKGQQLSSEAQLSLLTEAEITNEGKYRPVLPSAYGSFDFSKLGIRVVAQAVDPLVLQEEVDFQKDFVGTRSLHAKVMVMEGQETTLAYVGSANFTRRGWGLGIHPQGANIEAGIIIRRTGSQRVQLRSLVPATTGEPISLTGSQAHVLAPPKLPMEEPAWPSFMIAVTLKPNPDKAEQLDLVLTITPNSIGGGWRVNTLWHDDGTEAFLLYQHAVGNYCQDEIRVSLDKEPLNRLLCDQEVMVTWWGSPEPAAFPINVALAAREALPIMPGNNKLQEQHILAYYQGRISWEDLFPDPADKSAVKERDEQTAVRSPVDTSGIQSYQIREFVEALKGISEDLRQGCYSSPSMRLALFGPVSPLSLARTIMDAVQSGVRSPVAAGFQLVEILSCLDQAKELCIQEKIREEWRKNLSAAVAEVENLLTTLKIQHADSFERNTIFSRYQLAVRQKR